MHNFKPWFTPFTLTSHCGDIRTYEFSVSSEVSRQGNILGRLKERLLHHTNLLANCFADISEWGIWIHSFIRLEALYLVIVLNAWKTFWVMLSLLKWRFFHIPFKQSWVYSGVALIPFQVYSRSGVELHCSTPWSRTHPARLILFHWSRGVSFDSSLLQHLIFSRQNVSDSFTTRCH